MKEERNIALNSKPIVSYRTNGFFGHLFRRQNGHGHTFTDKPKPAPREPVRRPAKIARLLAFAHKIQAAIDNDEYCDLADAAKRLGYSHARISQIIKLMVLAPGIQEHILFIERVSGVESMSERKIRGILRFERRVEQRAGRDILISNH